MKIFSSKFHWPARKLRWPLMVFALGLLVTALLVHQISAADRLGDERRFDRLVERVKFTLEERVRDHASLLEGLRGLYKADPALSPLQFHRYFNELDLLRYPGALGYGFIRYVPTGSLDNYLRAQRQIRGADFQFKRLSDGAAHFLIENIEPLESNRSVLGLDLSSEVTRRQGVENALAQNGAVLTRRITLVQDEQKLAGFLLLLPVYKETYDRNWDMDTRWAKLSGWVYSPLRMDKLLSGVAEQTDRLIDFELYQGTEVLRRQLLFDADQHLGSGEAEITSADYASRRFQRKELIDIAGQQWTLLVTGNHEFDRSARHQASLFVLLAGLIVSLLVSALLATSYKTADEAQTLAGQMTAELRLSEQEAREMLLELQQQRMAMDQHAIVAITDPGGTINFVNEKFCAISGYSEKELIGYNHRILNSGFHPTGFFAGMYGEISAGRVWSADICNRAKDGHLYWVHTTVVPFMNSEGKPVKYVSIRSDITDMKAAEAELEKQRDGLQAMVREQTADLRIQRDRAQAANIAKTEFITNMSHELRTPMHGVLSLSDIGLKRAGQLSPEKQTMYFSGIHNSGKRLMRLVEDVMALSVLDVQTSKLQLRPTDMAHLLDLCVQGYLPAANEKKQSITIWPPACPVTVAGDRERISQVVGHLLNNAVKYSPPETSIEISLAPALLADGSAALQVSVADHGVGIPEGELESVFESFTQSSRTKTGAGGTGLGLAICRRVVHAHGGEIHAAANLGGGAVLSFTLPLPVSVSEAA